MYASLLISLLAAFVAMLGKQWLNRYLRHAGGSMIERCGDRQRKCDGLEKWPFHLFIESLPIMLQLSLLLLACGLCRYTWSINSTIAFILITLTVLGILFYFSIVIAGTSSYECPFQTPASTRLRSMWKEIQRHKILLTNPATVIGPLWKDSTRPIVVATHRFKEIVTVDLNPLVRVVSGPRSHADHPSPVVSFDLEPPSPLDYGFSDIPANSTGSIGPWLTSEDLTAIQETNAKDVRCVSWILRNITDPEALDAAIRLAGTVLWFEGGTHVEPPYSVIASIFNACLDSSKAVYPGLSDRAYYSARAMIWIHTRALYVSEEFPNSFPLPDPLEITSGHADLRFLLNLCHRTDGTSLFRSVDAVIRSNAHAHVQWTLYVILHWVWARQSPSRFCYDRIENVPWNIIPLDATLNILLVCSISLGLPVEGDVLKIQDKRCVIPHLRFTPLAHTTMFSGFLERVVSRLSRAIVAAIPASSPLLRSILAELTKWDSRPHNVRVAAHEWCYVICENYQKLEDGEKLVFHCLEISFRGVDLEPYRWPATRPYMQPTYTGQYQHVADIVSNSGGDETIADLLLAWIVYSHPDVSREFYEKWAAHLIRIGRLTSISRRLQQLAIHSIVTLSHYAWFEPVGPAGMEEFIRLFDTLGIGLSDLPIQRDQGMLLLPLLQVVHSPEGRRSLSYQYWELIPELALSWADVRNGTIDGGYLCYLRFPTQPRPPTRINYGAEVMVSLEEEQEWDRLECWMGFVWFVLRPKIDSIPEHIERVMLSLLRQRPGVAEKLEQRLQRVTLRDTPECLECLRQVRDRAGIEAASRQDAP